MKKRTIEYLRKVNAMKIMRHPLETDLKTFLTATFSISRNNVVKQDILDTIRQLERPSQDRRYAA